LTAEKKAQRGHYRKVLGDRVEENLQKREERGGEEGRERHKNDVGRPRSIWIFHRHSRKRTRIVVDAAQRKETKAWKRAHE